MAVRRLHIVDTRREALYDGLVRDAAQAFNAPVALLSIFEGNRQWVKASQGSELENVARSDSFCAHVLDATGPLEVESADMDERFRNNPFVIGSPGIRYYLGAPLQLLDGTDVGAICVIDTHTRPAASAEQRAYLVGLARQAAMLLERRVDDLEASR